MEKSIFLFFILLLTNTFVFCQEDKDSLADNYIYPPNSYNNFDGLTPKESWDIHKAAYIKQLKAKGVTGKEYKKSLNEYEKQKADFLTRVEEQNRIAEVQRKKNEEQRAKNKIQREKNEKQRTKNEIQREKNEEIRKKYQKWIDNTEEILSKNIIISSQIDNSKPISFTVTSNKTLYLGIRAHVKSGTTLIEIFNPKGNKEGELSLKSQLGSNNRESEYTSGAFDKTISTTEVGEWQIKISSQKSNGNVAMSVRQSIKSVMNE
ncbi:hypothetical protein [Flammeovirga agarivorans]|uniref:Uncharacterized protein n=1 Tax=Flammeovirga agarivorans TaxID=2726742 RepID=A0A7X8XVJ4_9BACT|nr:hypothetical protein [Flammeovirga agarivorans]NLR91397.1 hypothetical protein [Flammeovirga agarivorans]